MLQLTIKKNVIFHNNSVLFWELQWKNVQLQLGDHEKIFSAFGLMAESDEPFKPDM